MNKNPYLNAFLAGIYIVIVVSGLNWTSRLSGEEDSFFIPMFMLSFFVFSAAIMGYLFVLNPLTLYLDGKKQEAVTTFLKTLFTFALWLVVFGFLALN